MPDFQIKSSIFIGIYYASYYCKTRWKGVNFEVVRQDSYLEMYDREKEE